MRIERFPPAAGTLSIFFAAVLIQTDLPSVMFSAEHRIWLKNNQRRTSDFRESLRQRVSPTEPEKVHKYNVCESLNKEINKCALYSLKVP